MLALSCATRGRRPSKEALYALPALLHEQAGPVFNEPWEAEAFALAVHLSEAGHFTWPEWVEVFSQEIVAVAEHVLPSRRRQTSGYTSNGARRRRQRG